MSDWQAGDLALCVDAAGMEWALREGGSYTVLELRTAPFSGRLCLAVIRGRAGFYSDRFRKIRPDEHEACEPEFVALLKRIKQRERA